MPALLQLCPLIYGTSHVDTDQSTCLMILPGADLQMLA